MQMGDNFEVVIGTEDSSLQTTGSSNINMFADMLKHLVCSPAFIAILLALCLATSTINILIDTSMLFEWLAFFLFVCCTCVLSRMIVTALVFLTERYFVMRRDKTLYFVFALKTTVVYFFCSGSILFSWILYFKPQMSSFAIRFVTSSLATIVIATGMWIFKIVILKVLDCHFHDKNFFRNMQNQIYHEYVLQTMLMKPTREFDESDNSTMGAQLKWIKGAFGNMLLLACTRLHTICDGLDSSNFVDEHQVEYVISMVFKNLTNDTHRDIQETDLLWVMKKEEITEVLQLFEGAGETKSITEASLRKWMVKLSNERKLLVHLLHSTSTVIEELNKVILVNLFSLVALVWYLLMGFGTTRFIVYISSDHLFLLVFIFGNFCKMICEGIMLAIVMHPFDIGDLCIIDNEQVVIEKIGLISTDFLKDNNWKVQCLNSVLLTKFISNLNRSSDLTDDFEILISSSTSSETIAVLKLKIKELLGSNPESWHAEHFFNTIVIDDVNAKYNLVITHARKFQNYNEKKRQRSEFVQKLRAVLLELNIQNFAIQ